MNTEQYPHLTVATVVERSGQFLLVEEYAEGSTPVLNQPAGHVELGESLVQAAMRETLEETGWEVRISHYLGVALYTAASNGVTYCRHTFSAEPVLQRPNFTLDDGIIAAHWMDMATIESRRDQWRSPLLGETLQHYLNGHRYPLSALYGDAAKL